MSKTKMISFVDIKWGVHVIGPDNVLAAESFEDANQQAYEINKTIAGFVRSRSSDASVGYWPVCYARVAEWDRIASFPHDPSKTNWAEACS